MKKIVFFVFPILLIAGCIDSDNSDSDEKEIQGILNEHTNFTMYVSNQQREIDPVDINVFIDGGLIVSDDFFIGNMHRWIRYDINQTIGNHTIIVTSIKGNYATNDTFEVKDRLWIIINYWGHDVENNAITIRKRDHEPLFM